MTSCVYKRANQLTFYTISVYIQFCWNTVLKHFRCEKFILLCDIHGHYLFSTPDMPPEKKCCWVFFNPEPIFVNTGTCFTSYQEVWEVWPFTFSFIKIWLNVQSKISPGANLYKKILHKFNFPVIRLKTFSIYNICIVA